MKLRTQLILGYVPILASMIILAGLTYQGKKSLVESGNWVSHTYNIVAKAHLLERLMVDMETGERGFVITGKEEFLEPYTSGKEDYEKTMASLRELVTDPYQLEKLEEIDGLAEKWHRVAAAPIIEERRKASSEESSGRGFELITHGTGKPIMDSFRAKVAEFMTGEEQLLAERKAASERSAAINSNFAIYGTVVAVLFGVTVMILVIRGTLRAVGGDPSRIASIVDKVSQGQLGTQIEETNKAPTGILGSIVNMVENLNGISQNARAIATGDLQVEITPQSEKDVLGNALAEMVKKFREQIKAIVEVADVLSSTASQVLTSSKQLTTSTTETSTAVSQTTTTVEEVKQTSQSSNEKARQISEDFQKVTQISNSGKEATQETIDGMNLIKEQMESIAESVVRLSEQSQTVAQIISSVDDIAEQSNLLAVNAAVEAARAGEQGKGFAVVAEEIRTLAEQSKRATSQVREILGEIQNATSSAVMVTEQGSKVVDKGAEQTTKASDAIRRLTDSVSESAQAASQISAASQQQRVGMEQIAKAMEDIKQASEDNLGGTRQLQESARQLAEVGSNLKELVSLYRL